MSVSYHVYSNGGSGPVDYTTVLATVPGLTWTSSALAYPGTWKFGVRAFDTFSGLEEKNIDAMVTIQLDASGVDVSGIPTAPLQLAAAPGKAGAIVLHWFYSPPATRNSPLGFHVYQGMGSVNYATPVATVTYTPGLTVFARTVTGLTGGTSYVFAVRAYNATGEETNTATVAVTADDQGPAAVLALAGEAVP